MGDARLVSVVMAVHNGELFLDEAIRSILDQRFGDFEFIIIDDGSTDGTGERLGHYRQLDGRVQVHTQEKQGHAASLNQGCGLARGKYLARMDADDIALPDRFERQVAFLERHPQVAVLGGAAHLIDRNGHTLGCRRFPAQDRAIKKVLPHRNPLIHSTVMMRKAAFEAVQGYRPAFEDAEDYDLWLRMSERYQLANLVEPLGSFRIWQNQVSQRNRRHQAAAGLAAQASAAHRRRTGVDPFAEATRLTVDLFRANGISDDLLEERYVRVVLTRATAVLDYVGSETASQLLEEALANPRTQACQSLRAQVLRTRALIQLRQGRALRAVCLCGMALCLQPISPRRMIRRVAVELSHLRWRRRPEQIRVGASGWSGDRQSG
jgi:hypothetical protein